MSTSVLLKRTAWTVEDSIAMVRLAVERHDRYMVGTDFNVDCDGNRRNLAFVSSHVTGYMHSCLFAFHNSN